MAIRTHRILRGNLPQYDGVGSRVTTRAPLCGRRPCVEDLKVDYILRQDHIKSLIRVNKGICSTKRIWMKSIS